MKDLRKRWKQRIAALAIAALALVPVVLSGHHHASADSSTPAACSACICTSHAPAAAAAVPSVLAQVLLSTAVDVAVASSPASIFRPAPTGRAPPSTTPS